LRIVNFYTHITRSYLR